MTHNRTARVVVGLALAIAACGGSDDEATDTTKAQTADTASSTAVLATSAVPTTSPALSTTTSATVPTTPALTVPASTTTAPAPATTAPTATAAAPPSSTTSPEGWQEEIEAVCAGGIGAIAAIPESDGTAAGITAGATAILEILESPSEPLPLPEALQATLDTFDAEAIESLDSSIELAAAGDLVQAEMALQVGWDVFTQRATAIAIAGAPCGFSDPVRVQNADLTVPLEMDPNQLNWGFGSIWVSEGLAGRVVRLDPATGAVQATVDVGPAPLKLQPADGRMWVRTANEYVAIDAASNTVVARLTKADIGPSANRNWAVDGAMWICDGRRIHRYDPTTLAAIAALELDVDCNAVYATADLVVAWSYNEDDGESGTSAVAFVDPATNSVLATVALPVDVGGPALLGDAAFFYGYRGSIGVVVDLTTWTITATPDLGIPGGGTGQPAFDGESIYFPNVAETDLLRVDADTFTLTEIIEPLAVNAVVVDDDGALWVARGRPVNAVQRFDVRP